MGENKSLLLKSSMQYGLSMGIFWCIKYLFFMLGVSSNFWGILYMMLTLLVPFFAYFFTWRYKRDIGGKIGFFHAWQFGVLLYFFAALIVCLEHYIFYQYIAPPGFLANSLNQTLELLRNSQVDPQMIEAIGNVNISPIQMAIQGIFNNVFYGVIFSIPIAMIASRKPLQPEENIPPTANQSEENE